MKVFMLPDLPGSPENDGIFEYQGHAMQTALYRDVVSNELIIPKDRENSSFQQNASVGVSGPE